MTKMQLKKAVTVLVSVGSISPGDAGGLLVAHGGSWVAMPRGA